MDTFDFNGEAYKRASSHQQEWGEKLIAELDLNGNEAILDLGCGDGITTEKLAHCVPEGRVVGIDASHGMIESAKQREKDNLLFCVLNINDMDYRSTFDLIISNATLHWVKDHRRLLGNCHRALKLNGMVRFNFAGEGNCQNFFKVIREAMGEKKYCGYFKTFEWPWYMPAVTEYKTIADQSDFAEINVWGENADRYFPDAEAMSKWIDNPSIVPFLNQIPQENKASFREFVIDRMILEAGQGDGKCFETFRRINVLAKK